MVQQGPTGKSLTLFTARGPQYGKTEKCHHISLKSCCLIYLSSPFRKQIAEPGLVLPTFKVFVETRTGTDVASQALAPVSYSWRCAHTCLEEPVGHVPPPHPQFHVRRHHAGSLKSAMMGIFRPRKSAKTKTRTFAPPRAGCSAPSRAPLPGHDVVCSRKLALIQSAFV